MNTDTGEIRSLSPEMLAVLEGRAWTPLSDDENRAMRRLRRTERPAALREMRATPVEFHYSHKRKHK